MVAEVGEPIVLITYPGEEQQAAMRLSRIGSDNVIGYLTVGHAAGFPHDLADLVQEARAPLPRSWIVDWLTGR